MIQTASGLKKVEDADPADLLVFINQNMDLIETLLQATSLLTKLKTVDGAGSGLDADLLDGLNSTDFSRSTHDHATVYEPKNTNIQTHVASAHAPSTAQPNSDITKAEIEAKLTGGITTHSHGEANLTWGGRDFASSFGCIDASMIPVLGANRLAFIQGPAITVEYSRDSGATWLDYGASDYNKTALFSMTNWGSFGIGKCDSTNKATATYQLRVTINTGVGNVYTVLNKFCIYISSNGSTGITVDVDKALESTPTTFVAHKTGVPIAGWSGYNIVNIPDLCTYGNTPASQYGRVRFTFKATGGSTTYDGMQLMSIFGYGGVGWSTPSTLARQNTIYSYDASQNVNFPASLTATQIRSNVANGTAPMTVVSSTVVGNLNADLLDGKHATDFATSTHDHATVYEPKNSNIQTHIASSHARADATNTINHTNNGSISVNGTENVVYALPVASASVLGGVKQGTNITIDANGVISASGSTYTHPATHPASMITGLNSCATDGIAEKLKGVYISGGSELPNYFGSANLKLQMLTGPNGWGWCDTLWMSSYAGTDVKGSNQLVVSKSADAIGFRRQNFDATAWGPVNEIYHSGRKPTANELSVMTREVCPANLNDAYNAGSYRVNAGHSNMPSGCEYGQLLVIRGGSDTITQLIYPYSHTDWYYIRSGNPPPIGSGTWQPWRCVANFYTYRSSSGPSGGNNGEVWIQYS